MGTGHPCPLPSHVLPTKVPLLPGATDLRTPRAARRNSRRSPGGCCAGAAEPSPVRSVNKPAPSSGWFSDTRRPGPGPHWGNWREETLSTHLSAQRACPHPTPRPQLPPRNHRHRFKGCCARGLKGGGRCCSGSWPLCPPPGQAHLSVGEVRKPRRGSRTSWLILGRMSIRVLSDR